jgi:hypothetical protein
MGQGDGVLKLYISALLVELMNDSLDLGRREVRLGIGENHGADLFGVQYVYVGFALQGYEPSGQGEDGLDLHWVAGSAGEFAAQSGGVAAGLFNTTGVAVAGKMEQFAVEDDFVIAPAFARTAFTAGLGLDGVNARGGDDNVIDVPVGAAGIIVEGRCVLRRTVK